MSNYDYDIGIIGGGAAGLTVAAGAAQFGAKALLIEKSPRLGGDCLHYGCVPSKTLIRTNRSHIFAAGDINGILPFTHVAGYEGGGVLTNAVLRLPRKADYTNVPWCTYTDPEVASVGLNEKRAQKAGIPYQVLEERFAGNDRALAMGEPLGKIKVLVNPKGAIHVYPTLAEISKRVAGSYFSTKLFSDRTRSVLRLLFGLKGRACTPPESSPQP